MWYLSNNISRVNVLASLLNSDLTILAKDDCYVEEWSVKCPTFQPWSARLVILVIVYV